MPEEQRESEPRRATGAGDVDDLIISRRPTAQYQR